MTPILADDWLTIYGGDALTVLRELPSESVHCVVTSPPYWGLRDYGTPGQLGLEPTPEAYIAEMVGVFAEVRRVLRSDGTAWVNMGDSYAGNGGYGGASLSKGARPDGTGPNPIGKWQIDWQGLKAKDLVGIPWMLAFALRADGWYLRSDVIWAKPNPMPESVTDRPTKSHEYVFLLAKSPRYFYDNEAIREPLTESSIHRINQPTFDQQTGGDKDYGANGTNPNRSARREAIRAGRNSRTVWTIATAPYPGAHFATFPPKLVEPCVKAGTSERGVCPECGAPWVRMVGEPEPAEGRGSGNVERKVATNGECSRLNTHMGSSVPWQPTTTPTTGWQPTCEHEAEPVPAVVMDMFAGTGTVGMVAQALSRRAVLIDLNPEYLRQCLARNRAIPMGLLG